jgi:hypothetical protein
MKREKSKGSREDEFIPSKACLKVTIQSESQSEETDETDDEKDM